MSTSTPRRPLNSQKNAGGDMRMTFFTRSRNPRVFTSSDPLQMIKNFNVETVAGIPFPPPAWIMDTCYNFLRAQIDDSNTAYFSLNLAMYPPTLNPSEWDDKWFVMYARVHPYALTWEIEASDSLYSKGLQDYTIPVLMVRDGSYQS